MILLVVFGWIYDFLVLNGYGGFFFNLFNKLLFGKIRCLEFVWSVVNILDRIEKKN